MASYRRAMTVPPELPAAPPPPAVPYPHPYPPVARHTNGFAIAALVCSLVACGIGSILGIVFGHVARSQIKRTGEEGAGLALAGLIIGYASLAIGAVVFGGLILFATTVRSADSVVDHARDVDLQIVRVARLLGTTPRSRTVINQAFDSSCCVHNVTLGRTGVRRAGATDAELARVNWRLDIEGVFGGHACLTVPTSLVAADSDVTSGRC